MVRHLRRGKDTNGLILANGGVCTYQHVICLSSKPRKDASAYPAKNPLPPVVTDWYAPPIDAEAEGEAIVEVRTRVPCFVPGTDLARHTPLNSTAMAAHYEVMSLVG